MSERMNTRRKMRKDKDKQEEGAAGASEAAPAAAAPAAAPASALSSEPAAPAAAPASALSSEPEAPAAEAAAGSKPEAPKLQLEALCRELSRERFNAVFDDCTALFDDFGDKRRARCIEAFTAVEAAPGEIIVHQGDTSEAHFWVVATGTFDIYVLNGRKSRQDIIAEEQANGETGRR